MPALRHIRTGVVVSCSDETAARLSGREWVDVDADQPEPSLSGPEPAGEDPAPQADAGDCDADGPELDPAELVDDQPEPAGRARKTASK